MNCRRFRNRGTAGSFALATLLVGSPMLGQEAMSAGFGEVVDVKVVNLEVVVEDRDGVRVTGLGPADFRLEVDGTEVPIEYFTEVRGGEAMLAPGADSAGQPGGGGQVASMPSLAPGAVVGTSYLVFIDDFFALKRDRDSVLDRLREDLPRLGPADRMALVAYDGKRLTMVSSWSQSVPTLERAFRQALDRPAYGLQRLAERRTADRDQQLSRQRATNVFDRSIGTRIDLSVRDYTERLADQVERSVAAASSTLRSFAAPPGRKVMLILSGGWPYQPVQYTLDRTQIALPERDIPEGPDLFRSLVSTANLLGYTLYPVDVPGLQGETVDASIAGYDESEATQFVSHDREQDLQATLSFLAKETGGRALLNGRRTEVFERVADDTRSYYWLGFTPRRTGDERQHRIEVRSLRPGLRIRSRENFQDFSRQREVTMAVESALLFGAPPSSRPLTVTLGRPEKSGGRTILVPLVVEIPASLITLVPIDGRLVSQLELRIAALDDEGRSSEIPVIPINLSGSAAPRDGSTLPYATKVELRKTRQSLVVSLFDVASGEMYATTLEVAP